MSDLPEGGTVRMESESGALLGTGFLIDSEMVLTCWHVVQGQRRVKVTLIEFGDQSTGDVIWSDSERDLALLRLEESLSRGRPMRLQKIASGLTFRAVGFSDAAPAEMPFDWINGKVLGPAGGKDVRFRFDISGKSRAETGLSGAAAWCDSVGAAVGIVVSIDPGSDSGPKRGERGYLVPGEDALEALQNAPGGRVWSLGAEIREQLENRLRGSGHVRFKFKLAKAQSFENLVSEDLAEENLSVSSLLTSIKRRILLYGSGGAGKTSVLCQLGIEALDQDWKVFMMDLSQGGLAGDKTNDNLKFGELFDLTSLTGVQKDLESAVESFPRVLLLVDGLNEVHHGSSEAVLDVLDKASRSWSALTVVVADRFNPHRRSAVFDIFSVQPLGDAQLQTALGELPSQPSMREVLRVPFFLDLYMKLGSLADDKTLKTGHTRSEMFERYFMEIGGVTYDQMVSLAEPSFEAYRRYDGRVFGRKWWEGLVGEEVMEELESAGFFESLNGELIRFRHQLLHDHLVGRFLASAGPERWTYETFDAATFRGNSPESLSFAAELLDSDKADLLITAVYDWNYPATSYCLGDLYRNSKDLPFTRDPVIALTAMIAEKRFDPMEESADRADRHLRQIPEALREGFLEATSLEEVVRLVDDSHFDSLRFQGWRTLFVRLGGQVTEEDLELLLDDPIIGWTAANVFRRLDLSDREGELRTMCRGLGQDETTTAKRWRVVHVLGRGRELRTIEFLWRVVLEDPQDWVRYGAVRGLMELAHDHPGERRQLILARFEQGLSRFARPVLLGEVGRGALNRHGDAGWYRAVLPLLKAVAQRPEVQQDAETWSRRLDLVEKRAEVGDEERA